jgi:hypothetical protein
MGSTLTCLARAAFTSAHTLAHTRSMAYSLFISLLLLLPAHHRDVVRARALFFRPSVVATASPPSSSFLLDPPQPPPHRHRHSPPKRGPHNPRFFLPSIHPNRLLRQRRALLGCWTSGAAVAAAAAMHQSLACVRQRGRASARRHGRGEAKQPAIAPLLLGGARCNTYAPLGRTLVAGGVWSGGGLRWTASAQRPPNVAVVLLADGPGASSSSSSDDKPSD